MISLLWKLKRNRMDSHPQIGSDIKTDDTTLTLWGLEKTLFTQWHFLGRVGQSSQTGSKRFWENGNERLAWGFYMVMGWNWNESSHKSAGTKRRNAGTCHLWSIKGRGRVRHKSYQQSNINIKKNCGVELFHICLLEWNLKETWKWCVFIRE